MPIIPSNPMDQALLNFLDPDQLNHLHSKN